jgi:hypothetical protein
MRLMLMEEGKFLSGLMGEMRIRRQEEMLNTKIQQGRKEFSKNGFQFSYILFLQR